jgi:hypothetical protein
VLNHTIETIFPEEIRFHNAKRLGVIHKVIHRCE